MTDEHPKYQVFVLGNYLQVCCWLTHRLPQAGETLIAKDFLIEPGGKGLNVAVCLQRLGLQVQTLIGIGDDPAGEQLLSLLRQEGISCAHVHTMPVASGTGAGTIGSDGQITGVIFMGANNALNDTHAETARADIEGSKLVYGQFETALAAVERAFEIGHTAGCLTVLNPSPWQQPPISFYSTVHTLIVNETECCALFGFGLGLAAETSDDLPVHQIFYRHIHTRLSEFFLQWHATQRLIVTLGAGGVLVFERGGLQAHMPAHNVTAVDTLGAGDAFASAFCRAFVKYGQNDSHDNFEMMRLEYALQQGQLSGAHLVQTVGVLGALPNQSKLDELAKELPSLPLTLLS